MKRSNKSSNHSLLWVVVLGLNLITTQVNSTSQRNPSLHSRAISHPSSIQFKIIPDKNSHSLFNHNQNNKRSTTSIPIITTIEREPNYNDSFLLSFQSHSKPFTLSLRPSTSLIHPNGIKSYDTILDEEGNRIVKETRITREEIRAYEGWVLREGDDLDRWTREEMAGVHRGDGNGRGWVRLVLSPTTTNKNEEREEVQFQGAFETDEGYFTVFNTDNYLRSKEVLDPEPPMLLRKRSTEGEEDSWSHPSMIIVRERDVLSPQAQVKEMRKRGLAVPSWQEAEVTTSTSCGHDQLEFNSDPSNPVYDNSFSYLESTSSSDSLFSPSSWGKALSKYPPTTPYSHQSKHLDKRQGDIGAGTNLSSNFINSIGSTAGCPKSPMLVYLGIAADCTYVAHYTTADLARIQILTDINSASALYSSSFNLSLGIIELNVQSTPCPTSQSAIDPLNPWNVGCTEGGSPGLNLNDRLSVFSKWRGAKGGDGAGLWHLFTNCSTGSEVGVAWLGQLCKVTSGISQGQSTSGTGVTAVSRSEWQVFAHETGHSIGSIHDCTTGCTLTNSNPICCPLSRNSCDAGANFIMSPVSSKNVTAFSPCSIGNVCYALGNSLNTSCLVAPSSLSTTSPKIISLKSCGNGILEAGEDCDPGQNANDTCCDAKTCKFAPGAVCDPLNSLCCSSTCQLARAGTVCRPSVDTQCDTAEVCTGQSSTCPKDVFAADGKSCGLDDLACATGVCTSRGLQCQTAGISLGLTAACPMRASSSCTVTCADPSSSFDCIVLEQNFRDGSPCGYAGTCENSVCMAGAPIQVALSWYRQNLQIAIPVTIAVALLVLFLIYSLCKCGIQRSRRRQMAASSKYGIPMVPIRTPGEGEPGAGFRSKYMKKTRTNPKGYAPDLSQPAPVRRGDRRSDRFNGYNDRNGAGTPMIPNPSQNSAGGGVGSGFRFNRNGNADPNANIYGGRDWVDPVAYNGYENRG